MTATRAPWQRRGVATIEFALTVPLLLLMLAAIADLGLALINAMQLASGVANAARFAQLDQGTATSATLQAIVQDTSMLTSVQTSVSSAGCYCPSAGAPVTLMAATCGNSCGNGALPGSYQTITARYAYVPVLPGYNFLAGNTLTQTATVQVK